jgi:pimeloyl-ACP methyl ester carboxylesterase
VRTYILIALLPWLIFFAFADGTPAGLLFSSFGGLICLFIFNWGAVRKFFSFAWVSLIFFLIMFAAHYFGPKFILVRYNLFAATLVLAVFSFVSLMLHRPFTLSYAKIQAPKVFWNHPVFMHVNYWLTAVWGLVFLFYAVLVLLFSFGFGTKLWMVEILPTVALVFAIGFMILFPDIYKSKFIKKGMVAGIAGISEVQLAELGNITIGYRMLGEGPLLILANGAFTNMHSWDPDLLKKLSKNFQVLIFDYPGIGYSTYQQMPFSAETMVDCLYHFIDKLKLKPAAIVGYSMGGLIAQKFAVKYPNKLKALVLISTTCGGCEATWCSAQTLQKIERVAAKKISGEEQLDRMLSVMFTPESLSRFAIRTKKIITSAAIEGLVSDEMQQKEREIIEGWRTDDQLAQQITELKLPVLIIAGKRDEMVPFVNAELLEKKFSQAKLVAYDDAGHGVMYQYPLDVAGSIKEFLSGF